MKRRTLSILKSLVKTLAVALLGLVAGILTIIVIFLESRDDLGPWHTADIDGEYEHDGDTETFADYLELEAQLMGEVEEEVYAKGRGSGARFERGSSSDPGRWERDWNRTFELAAEAEPTAGVLLLHGMSDSPYSLRTLGQSLHADGAHVIGLRVPGHGAAPAVLTKTTWEDMAGAVRLAARHLKDEVGGAPIFLVGYSNGGALAVEYALSATAGEDDLPTVAGIVLLSPAIGVSPAAAAAGWQARLGRVLGLQKLAWNSISVEYDPFKYSSFPINAGHQVYRLTTELRERLEQRSADGTLGAFPPVLAFQSATDATVSPRALVEVLFARLPEGGHELVVFDINRRANVEKVLANDPGDDIDFLMNYSSLPFSVSLLTNRDKTSGDLGLRSRPARAEPPTDTTPLDVAWPDDVYALAHISLPFPGSDPLYGGPAALPSPGVALGDLALRGERGVLKLTPGDMLRLRWNPFYDYLESRTREFVVAGAPEP